MAGYWPSSFFCVFMDRDEVEVHKLAKTERGQHLAILTEQTWSIKDLLYGLQGTFSCGMQRVVTARDSGNRHLKIPRFRVRVRVRSPVPVLGYTGNQSNLRYTG